MNILAELIEKLPFVYIPVTVSEGLTHFLWESVEALDIIRITIQENLIVGI